MQGAYFARAADCYAQSKNIEKDKAVSFLAAIFSTIYVGLEVLCKGLTSLLNLWGGNTLIYGVMTTAAVGSAIGL